MVVILSPGPDNILVLTRGVTLGRRAAVVSACGASAGLVIHSAVAALGLSAILASSATAYTVVKYLGAGYLVYIGVRALLSKDGLSPGSGGSGPVGLRKVFSQAIISNVFNPKIAIFFLAYLPQFVSPASGTLWPQLLLHGLLFASVTLAVFVVIGHLSGALGGILRTRARVARSLNLLTGGVLISLGISLAVSQGNR